MKILPVLSLASGLLCGTAGNASLLVNDPFAYGAVDLTDSYGGWSDGTNNARYESSVTASWSGGDTDYVLNSAGGSAAANNAAVLPAARGIQLDLGSPVSGTFWLSGFLRISNTTGEGYAMIGFENGGYSSSGVDRGGFGVASDGSVVTTLGTTPTDTGANVPTGATAWNLFVAKITVNNSGTATDADDALKLWVFDNTSTIGGQTETLLGSALYSTSSISFGDDIQDVWFGHRENIASGEVYLDNLRISNLSTDDGLKEVLTGAAVPEPSTYALLAGFGALAGVMLRRRFRD